MVFVIWGLAAVIVSFLAGVYVATRIQHTPAGRIIGLGASPPAPAGQDHHELAAPGAGTGHLSLTLSERNIIDFLQKNGSASFLQLLRGFSMSEKELTSALLKLRQNNLISEDLDTVNETFAYRLMAPYDTDNRLLTLEERMRRLDLLS